MTAEAALKGSLGQELPLPSDFEEAAAMVSEEDVADVVVCGPAPTIRQPRRVAQVEPETPMQLGVP